MRSKTASVMRAHLAPANGKAFFSVVLVQRLPEQAPGTVQPRLHRDAILPELARLSGDKTMKSCPSLVHRGEVDEPD